MNLGNLRNLWIMSPAGVYIYIPFCRSRCSYCDFATGMYESELATRYVQAVTSEIVAWREVEEPGDVDTIYFGGGTPSLLTPAQIAQILKAIRDRFKALDGAEVTIELNPGDGGTSAASKRGKLPEFRNLGINRASFGAQTFDDLAAEMYRLMIEEVTTAGYEHYEISNFCLPGFESRHNTKYWTGAAYYGFGCSAHSYDGARRRWANERDAAKYVQLIEKEQSPVVEHTLLDE